MGITFKTIEEDNGDLRIRVRYINFSAECVASKELVLHKEFSINPIIEILLEKLVRQIKHEQNDLGKELNRMEDLVCRMIYAMEEVVEKGTIEDLRIMTNSFKNMSIWKDRHSDGREGENCE